jgi:hypothetical protein
MEETVRYPAIVAIGEGSFIKTFETYASEEEARRDWKDNFICLASDFATIERELDRV